MQASRPVAPAGGPLGLGAIRSFRHDPIAFLTAVSRAQGDVATVRFGPRYRLAVVSRPDDVRDLLVTHAPRTVKWERQVRVAARVLGPGALAILEGEPWQQNRRLLAPAFHHARLDGYVELIRRHADAVGGDWSDGEVVDVDAAMSHVTMGIIGEILFDIPDFEREAAALTDALHTLRRMLMLDSTALIRLPRWLPLPRFRREAAAMRLANDTLYGIIAARRREERDHGDVLSTLLQTVDADGARFSDREVRDALMGLFIAGHETTAVLMTWALYLVAGHADVQDELAAEARALGDARRLDDLKRMPFMRQVLNEALRLYPPAWSLFLRRAIAPIQLGRHHIAPGTVLVISPWIVQHRPDVWVEPEAFRPARFAGDYARHTHPFAFFPFGGGPRVCAGARLAELEASLLLGQLVRRFRFARPAPEQPIAITPRFTVRPVGGMPLRVTRRPA